MSTYLYGIVRAPATKVASSSKGKGKPRGWGTGVGDPATPIYAAVIDDLAALVSEVKESDVGEAAGIRPLRRDMAAHADLLNRVIVDTTVLPVRFGVVLPNEDALFDQILDPQYGQLMEYVERLEGAVELTVRATYVEEVVLQEVIRDQPRLAQRLQAGKGRSGGSYQDRIELGRQVAA